ncbi:MAG: heme peroxidase family protein [Bryobacteraceae bacterium]|nr:heme peroxidase family protein [Bryobacteraceae bacterium]
MPRSTAGAAPAIAPRRFFHGSQDAARAILDIPLGQNFQPGMFGRMFPLLKKFTAKEEDLAELGKAMIETPAQAADPTRDNAGVPAGFTYFGQFVDHDITLDTTPFPERDVDPQAVENFRTPALELDSVYGNGPGAHPFLYQKGSGGLFKIGANQNVGASPTLDHDLHRDNQGVALIGDPRNDENLIVAQLHLAIEKFHNKVMTTRGLNFTDTRRAVTLHYQWIVLHDFLPKIVDPAVLQNVLSKGRKFYRPKKYPFIPVEFAAAAYRFGHSMVRETYSHNRIFPNATLMQEFQFTGLSGSFVPVPSNWPIDWRRFFETTQKAPGNAFNLSRKIDAGLTPQLGSLPLGDPKPERNNLAVRNLVRGNSFKLPSGQSVAAAMGVAPLTPAELSSGADGAAAKAKGFHKKSPLWYYILKEAEVKAGGAHLGPVGSRIVAEVFVGLLEMSKDSILSKGNKTWRPDLGPKPGEFTMAQLVEFVGELNPVGD